jgi:polyhydroxyalkanoate synthesis regulator phasin
MAVDYHRFKKNLEVNVDTESKNYGTINQGSIRNQPKVEKDYGGANLFSNDELAELYNRLQKHSDEKSKANTFIHALADKWNVIDGQHSWHIDNVNTWINLIEDGVNQLTDSDFNFVHIPSPASIIETGISYMVDDNGDPIKGGQQVAAYFGIEHDKLGNQYFSNIKEYMTQPDIYAALQNGEVALKPPPQSSSTVKNVVDFFMHPVQDVAMGILKITDGKAAEMALNKYFGGVPIATAFNKLLETFIPRTEEGLGRWAMENKPFGSDKTYYELIQNGEMTERDASNFLFRMFNENKAPAKEFENNMARQLHDELLETGLVKPEQIQGMSYDSLATMRGFIEDSIGISQESIIDVANDYGANVDNVYADFDKESFDKILAVIDDEEAERVYNELISGDVQSVYERHADLLNKPSDYYSLYTALSEKVKPYIEQNSEDQNFNFGYDYDWAKQETDEDGNLLYNVKDAFGQEYVDSMLGLGEGDEVISPFYNNAFSLDKAAEQNLQGGLDLLHNMHYNELEKKFGIDTSSMKKDFNFFNKGDTNFFAAADLTAPQADTNLDGIIDERDSGYMDFFNFNNLGTFKEIAEEGVQAAIDKNRIDILRGGAEDVDFMTNREQDIYTGEYTETTNYGTASVMAGLNAMDESIKNFSDLVDYYEPKRDPDSFADDAELDGYLSGRRRAYEQADKEWKRRLNDLKQSGTINDEEYQSAYNEMEAGMGAVKSQEYPETSLDLIPSWPPGGDDWDDNGTPDDFSDDWLNFDLDGDGRLNGNESEMFGAFRDDLGSGIFDTNNDGMDDFGQSSYLPGGEGYNRRASEGFFQGGNPIYGPNDDPFNPYDDPNIADTDGQGNFNDFNNLRNPYGDFDNDGVYNTDDYRPEDSSIRFSSDEYRMNNPKTYNTPSNTYTPPPVTGGGGAGGGVSGGGGAGTPVNQNPTIGTPLQNTSANPNYQPVNNETVINTEDDGIIGDGIIELHETQQGLVDSGQYRDNGDGTITPYGSRHKLGYGITRDGNLGFIIMGKYDENIEKVTPEEEAEQIINEVEPDRPVTYNGKIGDASIVSAQADFIQNGINATNSWNWFNRTFKASDASKANYLAYMIEELGYDELSGTTQAERDAGIATNIPGDTAVNVDNEVIGNDGVVDTGVVDTGVVDTGVVDTNVVDTNVVDTNAVDTNVVDTGVVDTGVVDTGVVDTNVVDTNVVDTNAGGNESNVTNTSSSEDIVQAVNNNLGNLPGATNVVDTGVLGNTNVDTNVNTDDFLNETEVGSVNEYFQGNETEGGVDGGFETDTNIGNILNMPGTNQPGSGGAVGGTDDVMDPDSDASQMNVGYVIAKELFGTATDADGNLYADKFRDAGALQISEVINEYQKLQSELGLELQGGLAEGIQDVSNILRDRQKFTDLELINKYGAAYTEAIRGLRPELERELDKTQDISDRKYLELLKPFDIPGQSERENQLDALLGNTISLAQTEFEEAQSPFSARDLSRARREAFNIAASTGREYDPILSLATLAELEGMDSQRRNEYNQQANMAFTQAGLLEDLENQRINQAMAERTQLFNEFSSSSVNAFNMAQAASGDVTGLLLGGSPYTAGIQQVYPQFSTAELFDTGVVDEANQVRLEQAQEAAQVTTELLEEAERTNDESGIQKFNRRLNEINDTIASIEAFNNTVTKAPKVVGDAFTTTGSLVEGITNIPFIGPVLDPILQPVSDVLTGTGTAIGNVGKGQKSTEDLIAGRNTGYVNPLG